MDAKAPGNIVYILGETRKELGGSEYYAMRADQEKKTFGGGAVPTVDSQAGRTMYRALANAIEAGLAASASAITLGGLGVCAAKSAFAGMLGMRIDLARVKVDAGNGFEKRPDLLIFSETPGRFIVTVRPDNADAFEQLLSECVLSRIGEVTEEKSFVVISSEAEIINTPVGGLKESYKKTLRW